jgi:HTH-type transcriptional regulator/antitoxin HigA
METMMMLTIPETQKLWQPFANALETPSNEEEYQNLVDWLDQLIDEVGEDKQHSLAPRISFPERKNDIH